MGRRGPGASKSSDRAVEEALFEPVPWEEPGLTRADRVISFLEWLPITKGILAGDKMLLLEFQKEFIRAVYGETVDGPRPYTMGVQSVARGNGKTGLLAGLGLCHLVGPESEPRGEVYSAAIDREQAQIIFKEMEAIIYAVPRFDSCINVQRFHKTLEVTAGPGLGSTYGALSRDARRGHGLAPSFWIYDELAQAATRELLDNLMTGMGKRNESLGMVISTQAPNDQHALSELLDDSGDDTYVQLITAPMDADPFDLDVIRACNPAFGHFLDESEVIKQSHKAQRQISFEPRFRNLRLNQRISAETSFVSQIVWKENGIPPDEYAFQNNFVWMGLDLSARHDLTALVYCAKQGDNWHVRSDFFTPRDSLSERSLRDRVPYELWEQKGFVTATDGRSVDYETVAKRIIELCDTYDVAAVAFDRWRIDVLEKELERLGVELPLVPYGQGYKDMAPALDALESELVNTRMRHGNHPVLTWCASNSIIDADPAGNRKLNKAKSTGRIDGMVALAMALGQAERQEEAGSVGDWLESLA